MMNRMLMGAGRLTQRQNQCFTVPRQSFLAVSEQCHAEYA
jgi:hypothetical protein